MNTGQEIGKELPSGTKNWWVDSFRPNWEVIQKLDWFEAMLDCEQDPTFHAEGNVGLHTQMVIEALQQLEEFEALPFQTKQILSWSALLHDIAKPICTITDEEGYIRAPRHALKGEFIARDMLWDMDVEAREQICALVRLHGLPIWCLDKPNPNQSLYAASLRLTNEHLYYLAKADVLGRISEGQNDFLERIELYQDFAKEQACWHAPKVFANAHSQFKYFRKKESYPADLYDDTKFEVIILAGLPGCGKDTYAATLDLPVVSLDAIRAAHKIKPTDKKGQGKVAQLAYQQAKAYCAKKQSFIWNSTNLTKELRNRIISALEPYNPTFRIVYLETSKKNILERRRSIIPVKRLQKMFGLLEIPSPHEAHEVIYLRF